jgi:hypothetical protein
MTLCERCYRPEHIGEHGHMKCPLEARKRAPTVWADDIPGGVEIANALCNWDGTPKRYYSKSEIKLACEVKGITPYHDVYQEGGETRIKDAKVHDDWMRSGEYQRAKRERAEARRDGVRR